MEYISLIESTQRYGKSLSTIRKIINQTGSKYTKKGKLLNTGKHKVLISVDFLNTYFGTHSAHTENIEFNKESEHIKSLKNQIENQQKTIDKLLHSQEQFLQRQREMNILLDRSNEKAALLNLHFEKNRKKDLKTDDIQEIEEELEEIESTPTNEDSKHIDVKDLELSDWFKQFTKPS